jgi:SAM-dependent methyltransferase
MAAGKRNESRNRLRQGSYESLTNPVEVDFGTYHHSTPEESNEIRQHAERSFSKVLRSLYRSGASVRILDAGCGLGFLMYVAAKCFPKAHITGVDLFRHGSISGMSMKKAVRNMECLGIESRTSFLKHDLTKPMASDARYDLVLSNLVFHNMGNKRFKAYETVFNLLKPRGFFVIADVFRADADDLPYFRGRAKFMDELDLGGSARWPYKIRVFRKQQISKLSPAPRDEKHTSRLAVGETARSASKKENFIAICS